MSTKGQSPVQEPLPDMPLPPSETPATLSGEDLMRRRAFGAVPNLLQLARGVDLAIEVTPEDHQAVSPTTMYGTLFSDERNYREGAYVDGVLLNTAEYGAIARNVPALSRQVGSRILQARSLSSPDARAETADAGIGHTLAHYVNKQSRVSQGLTTEITRLEKLNKLARSPGFANVLGLDILNMAASAWTMSFTNILKTAGDQQGWSTADRQRAEVALAKVLSTGPQRERISGWQQYIRLAGNYAVAKRVLFNRRTMTIQGLIEQRNAATA